MARNLKQALANASELQMRELFKVYYQQCEGRRIEYTASEVRDGVLHSWIVMHGIELSFMVYQGEFQPIFMCGRHCKGTDETYYFKTFAECMKVWDAEAEELEFLVGK